MKPVQVNILTLQIFDEKLNLLKIDDFKKIPLYPTYCCFDDAIEFLDKLFKFDPKFFKKEINCYRLIHGIVNPEGIKFSHAWIEIQHKFVICAAIHEDNKYYIQHFKDEYYEQLKVEKYRRYTMKKMAEFNLKSGHFGPWEEPYTQHLKK